MQAQTNLQAQSCAVVLLEEQLIVLGSSPFALLATANT